MRKIDGVPADELFLAKIIQNAKALGLKSCVGKEFIYAKRDQDNPAAYPMPWGKQIIGARELAIGVCALGAAKLTKDTRNHSYLDIAHGNDERHKIRMGSHFDDEHGYTIGAAFQQAMNE